MSIAERRRRDVAEREGRLISAARSIAEAEGWRAVTIRRLAQEIEHSQPVVYSHFDNREAIVAAVAVEGFRELTLILRKAEEGSGSHDAPLNVALAYLEFSRQQPAVYEAMFTLPTPLLFAQPETRAELKDAFGALAAVVAPSGGDVDLITETLWSALHGLAELERSGRIREGFRDERVALIVNKLLHS